MLWLNPCGKRLATVLPSRTGAGTPASTLSTSSSTLCMASSADTACAVSAFWTADVVFYWHATNLEGCNHP